MFPFAAIIPNPIESITQSKYPSKPAPTPNATGAKPQCTHSNPFRCFLAIHPSPSAVTTTAKVVQPKALILPYRHTATMDNPSETSRNPYRGTSKSTNFWPSGVEGMSRPNAPVTERGLMIAPDPPRTRRWPRTPAVLMRYGDCERDIVKGTPL
jgi:hypothetical protein